MLSSKYSPMDDGKPQKLTPEEAGALVAQWAEHNPVTVEELAQRLNIDSNQMESLVRQSKGRLSMDKWLTQGKSSVGKSKNRALPGLLIGIVAFAVGGIAMKVFSPAKEEANSAPVNSTTAPVTTNKPLQVGVTEPPDLGQFIGKDPAPLGTESNSPAAKGDAVLHEGYSVGTGIAVLTVGGSHASIGPAPGMTERAKGAIMPIVNIRTGGKNIVDETSKLIAMKIIIPNDIVLTIETPKSVYKVVGKRAQDPALARTLVLQQYARPLDALMACALEKPEFPTEPLKLHFANAAVTVKIGIASVVRRIRWETTASDQLRSMFSNPTDPAFEDFIVPIMDQVKYAGLNLFDMGPRPLIAQAK